MLTQWPLAKGQGKVMTVPVLSFSHKTNSNIKICVMATKNIDDPKKYKLLNGSGLIHCPYSEGILMY